LNKASSLRESCGFIGPLLLCINAGAHFAIMIRAGAPTLGDIFSKHNFHDQYETDSDLRRFMIAVFHGLATLLSELTHPCGVLLQIRL
jgi:hypothetical protein